MSLRDATLLLLGHGSTLNADSALPTYQHAEAIRRRGIFAEVIVGFWKEEPNFRQTLRQATTQQVYVVPNFISSGYFTERVIPRELGLTGPISYVEGRTVFLCEPVGLHPSMTGALLERAGQVVAQSPEKIADPALTACLFICGHGTSFNDNSTKIIHDQAAAIGVRGLYAECRPVLMEQAPFVADWRTLTACPDVIVVPFFISDGLHSFEDIPVLLGMTPGVKEQPTPPNPYREGGRRLWYATAIGTEPHLAEVILAQVEQFRQQHGEKIATTAETLKSPFVPELPARPFHLGELLVRADRQILHRADADVPSSDLQPITTEEELRSLVLSDAAGLFRPLRAAPNLRRGWSYRATDDAELRTALDHLYPAALANAALARRDRLPVTPWSETAARQSGRFRVVREIDEAGARELVATWCEPGCLKRRLWPPVAQPAGTALEEVPLLCPEACNFLVGKAREKLKGGAED